ncbi:MAG: class I lanthipeptide [Chitinophaga sp.]|uniref:class I lanthipeptide n=1 Tax=Chitinophaga sp. TaxID=1869181 RepID=UPI0025C41776|nr:class I lanthipeptide [Chitinophaga sp.]MBV8253001.1 class I lanthipeptide [Chitinophaga sp.]
MKKKTLSLEKKLTLNKEAVALLTVSQQQGIAGGLPTTTVMSRLNCVTWQDTCETIPVGGASCVLC